MNDNAKSHKVERAVLMAAGRGSRLMPLTLDTPKPLLRVNGRRIIDTLLDALVAADISEIYVVRGYLKEKFDELLADYPMIHFIDNDEWDKSNNISSIVLAVDYLQNAYIMESDLCLVNSSLVLPTQTGSNYLSIPVEKTDDWCFTLGDDGYINHIGVGGAKCEQMVGISYWTDEDGARLAKCAKEFYADEKNRQRFWDEVALQDYISEFHVKVRECAPTDVIEIDTVEDLNSVDKGYGK